MTLWLRKIWSLLPFLTFSAVILILIGIIFLSTYNTVSNEEYDIHVIDYTNCTNDNLPGTQMCKEIRRESNLSCICVEIFELPESVEGNIMLYYELESFDQSRSEYVNSKDIDQLQGILNPIPSEQCEPYRYVKKGDKNIPIAPCGLIANTMFNDSFRITNIDTSNELSLTKSGMLTEADKVGYHNPENMEIALKQFEKPINWRKNISKFDTNNTENNGFQNELFIGWMKTEWKRKPLFRLLETHLPKGKYSLRVTYNYSPNVYDGPRKVILVSKQLKTLNSPSKFIIGVISLTIGFILAVVAIVLIFMRRKIIEVNENENNPINSNGNSANGTSNTTNQPTEESPLAN